MDRCVQADVEDCPRSTIWPVGGGCLVTGGAAGSGGCAAAAGGCVAVVGGRVLSVLVLSIEKGDQPDGRLAGGRRRSGLPGAISATWRSSQAGELLADAVAPIAYAVRGGRLAARPVAVQVGSARERPESAGAAARRCWASYPAGSQASRCGGRRGWRAARPPSRWRRAVVAEWAARPGARWCRAVASEWAVIRWPASIRSCVDLPLVGLSVAPRGGGARARRRPRLAAGRRGGGRRPTFWSWTTPGCRAAARSRPRWR